jgi:hypothetical protein
MARDNAKQNAPGHGLTKHGKPRSPLSGTCTCRQDAAGAIIVNPDCPIHGHLYDAARDDKGEVPRNVHGEPKKRIVTKPGA